MDNAVERITERKIGYKDVLTQVEYCKMLIANIISRFGDSVDALAFSWLVYQITGKASWSAIIFACNQLPTIVVQPFAGVMVEKMNKKVLMVVTDLLRAVVVAGLALLFYLNMLQPWILVVFTLCISTVEAFRIPAGMAVIPRIIKPEYYTHATALSGTVGRVVELIGMGAAGVIIGLFGIHIAILIDAVTFLGSGIILSFLSYHEEKNETSNAKTNSYKENFKEGFDYIKEHAVIKNFCIMGILINAIIVPLNSLQTPIVCEVLGQGSEFLSVFGITMTVGMGLGSFILPYVSEKFNARRIIVASGIAIGIAMAGFEIGVLFQDNKLIILVITTVCCMVIGIAASMFMSVLSIQFMKVVEQDYLARTASIFNASTTSAIPITSLLISGVVSIIPTSKILIASSLLCVILFIVVELKKLKFD